MIIDRVQAGRGVGAFEAVDMFAARIPPQKHRINLFGEAGWARYFAEDIGAIFSHVTSVSLRPTSLPNLRV